MNNVVRSLFAALALLLVGGCTDWSGDVSIYRQALDGKATSRPVYVQGQSLSLRQALQYADADNETIASRGEDYIQALAAKMRDAGTFLPTLTVAPSFTLSNGSASGFFAGTSTGGSTSGGSTGGTSSTGSGGSTTGVVQSFGKSGTSHQLSVPLSASASGSLSNYSTLKAAGLTVQQQKQLLLDERETILLQVVQSYYSILKAQRQSDVYESSLKFKNEKVRDQEARLKLGNVRPLDLAQTQADLAGTRVSLTQAHTDATNARSAVARLIGVDSVSGELTDAFEVPTPIPSLDAWQKQACTRRQDLLAADRQVEAARQSLQSAIQEYFPTLSIDFSYFLYSDPSSSQRWSNAISASIPIFSALSIEADIRRAWSVYRQAGLSQSQLRRQVLDDVNEDYQNVDNSRLKLVDLRIEVEAAQRAFDLSERAYQLGSVTNIDRLTQQDNLLTAQLNLISEQINQKSNYLALLRATGSLAKVLAE